MEDRPKSLANHNERAARHEMLSLPHIEPLTQYVMALRARGFGDVPYFDPLDGGTRARVLFLLEKPGPQAAGSGFISRNNDDPTAENTFQFMQDAGIERQLTCLWNVVPGWNGTPKVSSQELIGGVRCLDELFQLLPDLAVVVCVGLKAQRALPLLRGRGLPVLSSFHPSPKVYATALEKWRAIPGEWARAREYL